MIRIAIGFLIVFGAVGADDYAMASGTEFPPLLQTLGIAALGLGLAFSGVKSLEKEQS